MVEPLNHLLQRAWQVRQAHFPPLLGVDRPQETQPVSLTGPACALDCAHCGGHYLEPMLPLAGLSQDPRLAQARSLLISGGCDRRGRVPVRAHLEQVRALRPGRRLNWHVGLIERADLEAIRDLVDVVSFDLVGDDETIAEVYGLEATVEEYRATYRMLRQQVPVIPHITIGLRGGRISGERAALRLLQEEGAEAIVFLVLIPTPGTRYAACTPPAPEEVARLLAEARLVFPETPLLLGCMRPAGPYRAELDPLAVRAGVNRIVKPHPAALDVARSLGLGLEMNQECCVLPLPAGRAATPPHLGVSAGTEVVLGLRHRPMETAPTTAYLMLDGGGCAQNCAFCAQARGSQARADALSRIIWPAHPTEEVLSALERAPSTLRRICLQVTVHRGALEETRALVRTLRQHTDRPISVAARPADLEEVAALLSDGVEVLGIGLDAACERVYREVKGPGWQRTIALLERACRAFSGRIRVHLMVGLGESEQELVQTMQQVYDWGGLVSLFAFTPVRGTPLEKRPPPSLEVYRRMQVARYLLHHRLACADDFTFDEQGRLCDFGRPDLADLLADGTAFGTSGCPDCNRPFYNERPGGTMYNYPRPLRPEEVEQAIRLLKVPLGRKR